MKKNELQAVGNEITKKPFKSNLADFIDGYQFDTPEEKKQFAQKTMTELLEYYNVPRVKTDEEFMERTEGYFRRCVERGIKPTVEELALALGTTRQTLWDWEMGKAKTVSPDIVRRAKEILAAFDAKAVIEGKLFPTTYIYRSKNYYGMKDQQDVVVTPNTLETTPKDDLIKLAEELPED